jgi:hypothetical protein
MVLLLAQSVGHASAMRESTFLVHAQAQSRVVLRIYGETLVSSDFDRKTRKLKGRLWIQKISGDEPIALVEMEVGPLSRKDDDG